MKEKMTSEELSKRINTYIKMHTSVPKAICEGCGDRADLWDHFESENFCRTCLIDSLENSLEFLAKHT